MLFFKYLVPDESEPDSHIDETDGAQINESLLIVPWACLLVLLSKCQAHGCGEQVLPSNIKISTKGKKIKSHTILTNKIFKLECCYRRCYLSKDEV